MGKIDDAHDSENQREAAADQKQKSSVGDAVEGLNQPESRIHRPPYAPTAHAQCSLAEDGGMRILRALLAPAGVSSFRDSGCSGTFHSARCRSRLAAAPFYERQLCCWIIGPTRYASAPSRSSLRCTRNMALPCRNAISASRSPGS